MFFTRPRPMDPCALLYGSMKSRHTHPTSIACLHLVQGRDLQFLHISVHHHIPAGSSSLIARRTRYVKKRHDICICIQFSTTTTTTRSCLSKVKGRLLKSGGIIHCNSTANASSQDGISHAHTVEACYTQGKRKGNGKMMI